MHEQRKFVIFNTTEIDKIDFNEVLETSVDTLRVSGDGTKTFVKWESDNVPSFVQELTTKGNYLTYTEIVDILSGPEWQHIIPDASGSL